jgi:stage V sporulation protein B
MPAAAGLMVMAGPILIALYNDSSEISMNVMRVLGAASFFVCLQFVTTAILQANGYERFALFSIPFGGIIRITLSYILVAIPAISIVGSPIGTLVCMAVISGLNIVYIIIKVNKRPKFSGIFIRPLLCAAFMAVIAHFTYKLCFMIASNVLLDSALAQSIRPDLHGRIAVIICLAGAIVAGIAVYAVLIVVSKTITIEDLKLVPKGEKIAKFLRIK